MSDIFHRLEHGLVDFLSSQLTGVNVYTGDSGSAVITPYVAVYSTEAETLNTIGDSTTDFVDVRVIVATDIDNDAPTLVTEISSQLRSAIDLIDEGSWEDSARELVIHGMQKLSTDRANRGQSRGIIYRYRVAASYRENSAGNC